MSASHYRWLTLAARVAWMQRLLPGFKVGYDFGGHITVSPR